MEIEGLLNDGVRSRRAATPLEVLAVFTRLGCTCFGGPIAHLGYFRQEFVVRRRWLDEESYADLVALCQFLPGPASSQVGFSIGLLRAGGAGALAAWAGFTLPSAVLMILFAYGLRWFQQPPWDGALHALKIVAVAIVAQAVLGMARSLAPDRVRASIATAAALLCLAGSAGQLAAIAAGAVAGLWLSPSDAAAPPRPLAATVSTRVAIGALALFAALLVSLPVLRHISGAPAAAMWEAFYRSGALVFGGGHVVLPLLRDAVVQPGWVSDDVFLTGYGAAQAVPGPLFTFAAFLGAVMSIGPGGAGGGAVALFAIFLPGLLLVVGALPFWGALRTRSGARAAMRGVNAAVVGILAAALYNPVWTSAIHAPRDFALALVAFILLTAWRAPPVAVVAGAAAAGAAFSLRF